MKRRSFLATQAAAALGLGSILGAACRPHSSEAGADKGAKSADDNFPLLEATLQSLREQLDSGQTTSARLVNLYLERIEAIDRQGPGLRSVIAVNPKAVAQAQALDEERRQGKVRGPLHGIPVLVKDNIDTSGAIDDMPTTAGSVALEGRRADRDAFIVERLRQAGAIILGKTNLSEWANFRSSDSSSGWSSLGGQTCNPYYLDRNPCGSSSGSGVAVSANLCAVAVGTETDGSIVCPSAVNGIVGIKPTVGLVSRSGIVPISHTQDTAGPMARTVADAALLLGVLAGHDPADEATANSREQGHSDYARFLDPNGLKGKRIGIERKRQGSNPFLHRLLDEARAQLESLGATVVEVDYLEAVNALGQDEFTVLLYEFKDGLNRYLAQAGGQVKTLADVIRFNQEHLDRAMPFFRQDLLELSESKGPLSEGEYRKALERSHNESRRLIDACLATHQLDALFGLTMGPACATDPVYGDRWGDVFLTRPAAISGYPHITVPAGRVYDLPVGVSFFGTAYTEPALIGMAYAYEQATRHRQPPAFRERWGKGL
jgi:amidase